jgi:CHASE2 domain-containing sensor protein
MDTTIWLLLAIFIIGLVALIGFFVTKTRGFGRFATSTFLLLLIVIICALLFTAGKLDGQILANIFFSVIGFAGGLFTETNRRDQQDAQKIVTNNTNQLPDTNQI